MIKKSARITTKKRKRCMQGKKKRRPGKSVRKKSLVNVDRRLKKAKKYKSN